MGIYNKLSAAITCPHCHKTNSLDIDLYFGDTRNMRQFVIGSLYTWLPEKTVEHGGRPPDGNIDGEGYAVCPNCQRDFFVNVLIRDDRIAGVEPDLHKPGHIQNPETIAHQPSYISPYLAEWKPILPTRKTGKIKPNPEWKLTPRIEGLLEKLAAAGVDIYSTDGDIDYTMLVPHGLSKEEYQDVVKLMESLGKALRIKLVHVDSYPHGDKFRISPKKHS